MPRVKTFPDAVEVKDLKIILPADKLETLRVVARSHGLAVTDYVRSLLFTHIARITNEGGKS
jgi:hypothetical protein